MKPIAVTGMGAVSAWGWSVESLRQGMAAGRTGIAPARTLDTSGQRTHCAAEVPPPPPDLCDRFGGWRHLSRSDRFAVAAALEACLEAAIDVAHDRAGVFFGGSTAGMLECEDYVARLIEIKPERPHLRLLASQQINGPGDAVARHLRVAGPVETVSSACASGGLAIAAALEALRDGAIDVAIAGGADALCRLTYSGFNSLRSVDEQPCRPFRADRAGLSIGEGAAALILERLDDALARDARPLALLLGAGASCDAHHMTAPHPEGEGAALAIRRALADAEIEGAEVAFVNAHGTGTPHNDVSEARAIAAVFGSRAPTVPVTAPKAAIGHLLGSSGAIEAVATVLALLDGAAQPTAGSGSADSELAVDLVLGEPRPLTGDVGISTSFAFGGANAVLVFASFPRRSRT
jgi:3-oxoacyl-[acyl-carrier-protein] synthase II